MSQSPGQEEHRLGVSQKQVWRRRDQQGPLQEDWSQQLGPLQEVMEYWGSLQLKPVAGYPILGQ